MRGLPARRRRHRARPRHGPGQGRARAAAAGRRDAPVRRRASGRLRRGVPAPDGQLLRPPPRRVQPAGPGRPRRLGPHAAQTALRRAAAAPCARRRSYRAPRARLPRRAHGRHGPAGAARDLGHDRRAARQRRERDPDHPLHGGSRAALRPHRDHRPRAPDRGGDARRAHRRGRPAQVPRRARPGHRGAAGRAAAGQPRQGVPGRPLRDRGARQRRSAHARRGDRLVRRARRAPDEPAHREPHPGRRVPRADREGASLMTAAPSAAAGPSPPSPAAFEPSPGAAPMPRMIAAQAATETRRLLRNGEQLLLTLIIPLLSAFSLEPLVNFGTASRVDFLTPGIIALAVLSTAFTSQAIATGFERRYGVLKRLGATPLSRGGLIAAKTVTVIAVELLQAAVIAAAGAGLGWRPDATPLAIVAVPLLVLAGTAAFSGFALLMAGTLRAEATLAGANLVYLVLLGIGGMVFPLDRFPAAARPVLAVLPPGALSTGLRDVLAHAGGFPWGDLAILAAWAIAGITLAARTFRWE